MNTETYVAILIMLFGIAVIKCEEWPLTTLKCTSIWGSLPISARIALCFDFELKFWRDALWKTQDDKFTKLVEVWYLDA